MTTADLSEAKLYLTHVHCADCVRDLISDCVMKIEGVASGEFYEEDSALTVKYDRALVKEDDIRRAIQEIGYGIREPEERPETVGGPLNALAIAAVILFVALSVWWMRSL